MIRDPLDEFRRHDAEQEKWLTSRPICKHCCQHIQDDHFYVIDDYPVCPSCLESDYRVETEDYIE